MKFAITTLLIFCATVSFGQIGAGQAPDCDDAEYICNDNSNDFSLSIGQGATDDIPTGNNISNPNTNPGAAGNSGCLLSGELNPNWFVMTVGQSGVLEFQVGSAGSNGYYDWALWPYNATACADIQNNTLPPVACNWNSSSAGFTGMYNPANGIPPGADAGNFEIGLPVNAGDQFVLCFSNFSSGTGVVPMTFPQNPGSASIACSPNTPNQTICLGESATVDIVVSGVAGAITYNWLVTTGVSDPTAGTGVIVTPTDTTDYYVEIFENGALATIDTFTINVVPPPTPTAGPDQDICLGDPIQLDGTQDKPTTNILWTVDVGGITPAPNVNYTPSFLVEDPSVMVDQPGTYLFAFRETDAVCGVYTDTVQINVFEQMITANSVAPSCAGYADGEIHIDSPGAVEYSFDGGTTWVADSFATTFADGTYNVCGRSALGCEKCMDINVVDPPPVVVSVSNDTLICQNGTAYLQASATGGTTYLFHWDHTTSTSANQDEDPLVATMYYVYAENENGCTSPKDSIEVTVRDPLTGTISPWDTICPGYPENLTATVTGGIGTPYNFVWSSSETQNGPASHTIEANPPVTQDYTVTVTDGCESTPLVMQTNVRVAPLPVPQYTVLDPEQCEPAIFHIVNTTDPTMSQYNYWLFDGDQQYVNQDTIVTEVMMAGSYPMQMIITSYEGCVDSLTFADMVTVKPKPKADFKYTPNPVLMFNTTVNFTNYSLNGYTYQWYFDGGIPGQSTQKNVTVEYPDGVSAMYDVQLITTSELGCVDTMDHQLVIFPEVLIYAPNAFTPDGDEFNQDWRIYIEGIDKYDFELLIFNRWGEVIWESHDVTVPWDGMYNGKPLPQGTYNWVVRTKNLLNDNKHTYKGDVTILK